jgi:hypothetical protein
MEGGITPKVGDKKQKILNVSMSQKAWHAPALIRLTSTFHAFITTG